VGSKGHGLDVLRRTEARADSASLFGIRRLGQKPSEEKWLLVGILLHHDDTAHR
jgi:hypothetical protein